MQERRSIALNKMLGYLKDYKRESVLAPLFKMLEATFDLFVPLVMADIVNIGIAAHDFHYILVRCGILLLLAMIGLACSLTAQYFSAKAAVGYSTALRHALFEHIQTLSFTEMDTLGTSTLITRMTSDVNQVQSGLNLFLRLFLRSPFVVIGAMVMAFTVNSRAALIFVVTIPLLSVVVFGIMAATRPLYKTVQNRLDRVLGLTRENLTGVRVVRAFGRERFEKDKFNKQNDLFSDLWVRLGHVMGVNWGIGDLLSGIQVLTIIAAGIVFVVDGAITEGEYLAFVAYNSMLVWPTRSLGRLLSELSKTGISSKRIFEILDAEPEKDAEPPVTPPMDRDIVFKHVNFSYGTSGEVLHDIDLKIPAGTTLGILGSTGSGKSTLTYLLDRLYELPEGSGEITIGGVDIRNIALSHLRGNIGIVLQEPFLFSKSFKDTISDGSNRHDIESVRKYARLAVIDDTIDRFAEGYDTQIGERGVTISGGQKQRVAIARMLMQNTPIKIFDDSLSAVDMETDAKIRESINKNVRGTTILIAHRITTIMNADQIIVMDKGRIVQRGTHETLSKEDGIYKRIYDTQRSAT